MVRDDFTPQVRDARVGDAVAMAALSAQLGYPLDPVTMAGRLQQMLIEPRFRVRVVELGPRVAGWAAAERRLTLEGGERFELAALVVEASARSRGLGRCLLGDIEAWVRGYRGQALMLRSNAARERAHAFYERAGYRQRSSQHVYERDLRMSPLRDGAGTLPDPSGRPSGCSD